MIQENPIKEFTDLKTWQEGHKLVISIYKFTENFPQKETYSLVDQMRRAATSITSNIAEGFGRQGYKEKIQFYYLAHGSLTELKNQIIIAKDIGYLSKVEISLLSEHLSATQALLRGLIKKTKELSQNS